MPRYDILSQESMATLHAGWRRIVSEIGIEFASPWAVDMLKEAGQEVSGENVKFDPDWVMKQVAKAPREFDLRARNPKNNVHIGGDSMVFGAVYGPPFVREGDVRRDGSFADYENFCRLAQSFDSLDSVGGVVTEPNDLSLDSRHLDMAFAAATLTDKFFMGNVVTHENAKDVIRMAEIIHGGRAAIEETPALISLVNCNSPLRWDDRMLDSMREYALAGQPVVTTPFLLMGAMSPVTIPATLAQQMAEALVAIALVQLIRPGAPVVFGSFLSNIDMQSGSPQFGNTRVRYWPSLHWPNCSLAQSSFPWRWRLELITDSGCTICVSNNDDDDANIPIWNKLGNAHSWLARRWFGFFLRQVRGRHRNLAIFDG